MPINLTINNKTIAARDGDTILDAARANGINIPTCAITPTLAR